MLLVWDPPQAGRRLRRKFEAQRRIAQGGFISPEHVLNWGPHGTAVSWGSKQPPASLGLPYFREDR